MLKNKTLIKVISLLMAIGLWAYVMMSEKPPATERFVNLPVQIINSENLTQRGLVLIGDTTPTVSVTLEGKKVDINRIEAEDIIVTADIFGYSKGENHVPVTVQVPDKVTVKDVRANKIMLNVDELLSVAKSVEVRTEGNVETGKELAEVEAKPNEIMLTGAKSILDTVTDVYTTISPSSFREDRATVSSAIKIEDKGGLPVEGIKASVNSANISARLLSTKTVPLNVSVEGTPDGGYMAIEQEIPETVTIRGPKAEIAGVAKVDAEPINLDGQKEDINSKIVVNLPEEVSLSKASQDLEAKIKIRKNVTRIYVINSGKINFEGLREGLRAEMNNTDFSVTVVAPEELLADVTDNTFVLRADLSELETGTHTVPVELVYENKYKSVNADKTEIQLTINEES